MLSLSRAVSVLEIVISTLSKNHSNFKTVLNSNTCLSKISLENFIKNSDELLQQTVYLEIKFEEICHLVTPWNLKQSSLKHAVVY